MSDEPANNSTTAPVEIDRPEASEDAATEDESRRRRRPGGTAPGETMDAEILSVNETAAQNGLEAQLAAEAAAAARLRAASRPQPTPQSAEGTLDEGISMDFDKAAEPIPTHGSTGGLFPGVECTTVAMLQTRSGRRYINRYGPTTCPWFVIADSAYDLPDGEDEDVLIDSGAFQCVSDPNSRVLDFPHKQTRKDNKPKKEDVKGILYAVSDLPLDIQGNPLEMIKALDPAVVKRVNEFKDLKARQQASKAGQLGKYPSTYLLLEFKTDVQPNSRFEKHRSWELSSKFRALHGSKGQLSTEHTIYTTVQNRARRFLAWYKARHPEDFQRFEAQADGITAVERTPSKSPQPVSTSGATIKDEPRSPRAVITDVPTGGTSEQVTSTSAPPTANAEAGEDEELTEEERKEQAEMAWRMMSNIPAGKTLDKKETAKFNTFYRLARANGVV